MSARRFSRAASASPESVARRAPRRRMTGEKSSLEEEPESSLRPIALACAIARFERVNFARWEQTPPPTGHQCAQRQV